MTTLQHVIHQAVTDSAFRQQLLAGDRDKLVPFLTQEEQEALLWAMSLYAEEWIHMADGKDMSLLWVPGATD